MPIKLIVAYDENHVIGNGNQIPWRIREDMIHFKKVTTGCPVIMGRKTWESLPKKNRPLSDRTNIVISRHPDYFPGNGTHNARTLEEAVAIANGYCQPGKCIWGIGGGQVYVNALNQNIVEEIIASEVYGKHEGDVFFPVLNSNDWSRTILNEYDRFRIVKYRRNN